MDDCICHTVAVAVGEANCDSCDDEVVTYDDLIATHHQALLGEYEEMLR